MSQIDKWLLTAAIVAAALMVAWLIEEQREQPMIGWGWLSLIIAGIVALVGALALHFGRPV